MNLVLVLSCFFLTAKAFEDGSGDSALGPDDEDEDDLGNLVIPTRVIPNLQSPDIETGLIDQGDVVEYVPQRKTKLPKIGGDRVYLEDGSGDDSARDLLTPTWVSPTQTTPGLTRKATPTSGLNEDQIETGRLSNHPPVLQRKLRKIPIIAGRAIR